MDRKDDIESWFQKYYKFVREHIKEGVWSDFHLPRPIKNYRTVLNLLQGIYINEIEMFDKEFLELEDVRKMDEMENEQLSEDEIRRAYILRDKQMTKNYYNDVREKLKFNVRKLRGNNFPNFNVYLDEKKAKELYEYAEEENIEKFYESLNKTELLIIGW